MSDDTIERGPGSPVREYEHNGVLIRQQGRVLELSHPDLGKGYLIDVTDQEDLSDRETDDSKGETIAIELLEQLRDPRFRNKYNANNGMVAALSPDLDPQQSQSRVFLGTTLAYQPERRVDQLESLLHQYGFERAGFYIPMTVDHEHFTWNVMKAVREIRPGSVFGGLEKRFIYIDPNSDEDYASGNLK